MKLTKFRTLLLLSVLGLLFINTTKCISQNIETLKNNLKTEKKPIEQLKIIGQIVNSCEVSEIKFYGDQGIEIIEKLSAAEKTNQDVLVAQAKINNSLSYYFHNASLYTEAQEYAQQSILLSEKHHLDTAILGDAYNNLATVFMALKQYEKAVPIIKKNVFFDASKNNDKLLAIDYTNLSFAFNQLKMGDSAIYYSKKSIAIKEKLNATLELIDAYRLLGTYYLDKNNIDSAQAYVNKGLNYAIILKDKTSFQLIYLAKAMLEIKMGNTKNAETYLLQSLQYSEGNGNLTSVSNAHLELYKIYNASKDFSKALIHYKSYITYKDSALSQQMQKDSELSQVKFTYSKKELDLEQQAERERIINEEKQQRQKLMIIFAIFIIILVVVFLLFVLNRARLLRKQKQFIEEQRDLLDKKNTTITENINYAQNIQGSLIPSEQKISTLLNKECFVIFQPKDIVSGDFYWSFAKGNKQLILLADCTGHGVTGAFISILAIKSLEKVVSEVAIDDLSTILKRLHNDFLLTFGDNSNDHFGIELVMCCFDSNSKKLLITGSSNSVCIVNKGELETYQFDSISIGTKDAKLENIKMHSIDMKENSSIYLFTDGYFDQKGGPQNKKYMSKKLKNTFTEIEHLPIQEQKAILTKNYTDWKMDNEQIDDVSVIGIKCK